MLDSLPDWHRGQQVGLVDVHPVGAVTVGLLGCLVRLGEAGPALAASAPVAEPDEVTSDQVHPPLRVRTLGGFAVWCGTKLLPADAWTQRKAALLFKCLVSAPRQRLHREQLSELLRPEE